MPTSAWGAPQWCPVQWQSFGVQIRENQWVESCRIWIWNSPELIRVDLEFSTHCGDWWTEAHCLLAKPAFILLDEWTGWRLVASWGAFAPFVYFASFNLKLEMSQKASQSHDWYWLVRTSLAQNSWRRFAFFFFTVVRNSKNVGIWWERKVDSCPLYLLLFVGSLSAASQGAYKFNSWEHMFI